jgi:hypothetical protein
MTYLIKTYIDPETGEIIHDREQANPEHGKYRSVWRGSRRKFQQLPFDPTDPDSMRQYIRDQDWTPGLFEIYRFGRYNGGAPKETYLKQQWVED